MIEWTDDKGIRNIELARPDKRNAMLPEMLHALVTAVESTDATTPIALTGQGKVFCAGFDLRACAEDESSGLLRDLLTVLSSCVKAMRDHTSPVVLGIHGAAVAGGCALLGGADIVVCERGTKLGYPVVKIGVSPAVSSPFMLGAMRPGVVRTRLLDTQLIDAQQALRLGMVHEVCDGPETARSRCSELARSLAQKPGHGCRATKAWLNEVCAVSGEQALRSLDTSLGLTGNDEQNERLAALWG